MRRWIFFLFLALVAAKSSAQTAVSTQQWADQIRLQRMQSEADFSEIARLRQEREQRRAEAEREQQMESLREQIAQRDDAAATAAAEMLKMAEESAEELREEMQLAAVRSANVAYLLAAIGLPVFLGIFVARSATRENGMKYEQKFGVVIMLCSLLLALLALSISDNWHPKYDVIQNVMGWLRIRLIPEYENPYAARATDIPTMIDVPTKYILTALAAFFSYGFLIYLGIAPAAWKQAPEVYKSPDVANEK